MFGVGGSPRANEKGEVETTTRRRAPSRLAPRRFGVWIWQDTLGVRKGAEVWRCVPSQFHDRAVRWASGGCGTEKRCSISSPQARCEHENGALRPAASQTERFSRGQRRVAPSAGASGAAPRFAPPTRRGLGGRRVLYLDRMRHDWQKVAGSFLPSKPSHELFHAVTCRREGIPLWCLRQPVRGRERT
jgi:hypothetical protein